MLMLLTVFVHTKHHLPT